MGLRVIYVLTHDSIGLGEDGPTHQPVEHLASLRAMPNLNVFRPADAIETAECWELALGAKSRPSVLALSRQNLPTLRTRRRRKPFGARRLCRAGARGRPRRDPARHRLGGGHRAGGRETVAARWASAPRSSRCRASSCSPRSRRNIAPRCWEARRASGSRRRCGWAGTNGLARTASSSA